MATVTTRPDVGRVEERAQINSLAAELYREHRCRLLAIARRNAANPADAEEALQFAFCAFLEKFNPNGGAPSLAWLILTLKRCCWAKRRAEHLDRWSSQDCADEECAPPIVDLPSQGPDAEELIVRAERTLDARRRFSQLKPDERRALLLIGAGFSYHEICHHYGWSHTKVNRCLSEGRAALSRGHRAR